jgi:hypothetical protein
MAVAPLGQQLHSTPDHPICHLRPASNVVAIVPSNQIQQDTIANPPTRQLYSINRGLLTVGSAMTSWIYVIDKHGIPFANETRAFGVKEACDVS